MEVTYKDMIALKKLKLVTQKLIRSSLNNMVKVKHKANQDFKMRPNAFMLKKTKTKTKV